MPLKQPKKNIQPLASVSLTSYILADTADIIYVSSMLLPGPPRISPSPEEMMPVGGTGPQVQDGGMGYFVCTTISHQLH